MDMSSSDSADSTEFPVRWVADSPAKLHFFRSEFAKSIELNLRPVDKEYEFLIDTGFFATV
jgi:hypothetical protein